MQLRVAVALLAFAMALLLLAAAPAAHAATSLDKRISRAVVKSGMSRQASVVVYNADTRRVLYTHQQGRLVAPASNQKMFTTAAVLHGLGPHHRFKTRVALRGEQSGSTFRGDVYLIGGGDPSLSTRDYARRYLDGWGANIGLLTSPLRARGIKKVEGRIIVDASYHDGLRYAPAWPSRFRYTQSQALGALTVNRNWAGSYTSTQPDLHAGGVFRQVLKNHGITVTGRTVRGTTPESANVVGAVQSPPLKYLLRYMMKRSDNFSAEILLKNLGREIGGTGSTATGAAVAKQRMRQMGIDVTGMRLTDGSGLSYANRTSASQLAVLLDVMDRDARLGPLFRDSMAVSGGYGTMSRRLSWSPYRYQVRGKTGTLRQTSALSGYATRTNGRRYGFAVVVTNPGGSVNASGARALQDSIAATLVR